MTDSFKFGNDGKKINIDQFKTKLDKLVKNADTDAWKLFSLFDTDHNGKIDEENSQGDKEADNLFKELLTLSTSNNNDELEEAELEEYINKTPSLQEDKGNILNSVKNFLNLFNEEEYDPDEVIVDANEFMKSYISDMENELKQNVLKQQNAVIQKKVNEVLEHIYLSDINEITLHNSYNSVRDLAIKLLKLDNKKKYTKEEQEQIDNKIIEIYLLNNNKPNLQAGATIVLKGKPFSEKLIQQLRKIGLKSDSTTIGIYSYINSLDKSLQTDLINRLQSKNCNNSESAKLEIEKWQQEQQQKQFKQVREVAIECLSVPVESAVNLIDNFVDNLGVLDSEWWTEKLGGLIDDVVGGAFEFIFGDDYEDNASTLDHYKDLMKKEIKKAQDELRETLNDPVKFKAKFKQITGGVEYDEEKIINYINAVNSGKDGKEEFEAAFGKESNELVDFIQKQIGRKVTFNSAASIGQMIIGFKAIGTAMNAGWQALAVNTNWARNATILASTATRTGRLTKLAIGTSMGSASMGLYDLTKNTSTIATKFFSGVDVTKKDFKNLKDGTLNGLAFGAFAHLFNVLAVSRIESGVLKLFEKGEFTGEELMAKTFSSTETFTNAVKKGKDGVLDYLKHHYPDMIAGSVGFAAEVGGFTTYEVTSELLSTGRMKQALIEAGAKEEDVKNLSRLDIMRNSLIMAGADEKEINSLSDEELVFAYLGEKYMEQGKNLLSFKGVGKLLQWRMSGRIAMMSSQEQMRNIASSSESLKNIKIKPIKENGKKVYQVTLPNGDVKKFGSRDHVLAVCQQFAMFDYYLGGNGVNQGKKDEVKPETETNEGVNDGVNDGGTQDAKQGTKPYVTPTVQKTAYMTEREKFMSSRSAREATDENGNKIIAFHLGANMGDYTCRIYDIEGNFVEEKKVSPKNFEKEFGIKVEQFSKLNKNGILQMSIDFGIVESLVRTIKLNYDHSKMEKAKSPEERLAVAYGIDINDKEYMATIKNIIQDIDFSDCKTQEEKLDLIHHEISSYIRHFGTMSKGALRNYIETLEDAEGKPVFDDENKQKILRAYSLNPSITSKILNYKDENGEKRFGNYEIEEIDITVELYEKAPKWVEELLSETNPDGSYRFDNLKQINIAVFEYLKAPDFVERLITDKEPNNVYRFYHFKNVPELLEYKKKYPELVERLLNEKQPDDSHRFHHLEGIIEAIKCYEQFPELTKELLNMKIVSKNKELNGSYRFDGGEFKEIRELYEKEPELTRKLLDMKDKDGNWRFDTMWVEPLIECYKQESELTDRLINMRDSKGYYKNGAMQIIGLFQFGYKQNPELVRRIIDLVEKHDVHLGIQIKKLFKDLNLVENKDGFFEILTKFPNLIRDVEKSTCSLENPINPEMRDYILSGKYLEDLKKHSAGKYQKEFLEMLSPENLSPEALFQLVNTGISIEDFLESAAKMSKSTYKLAWERPNQYLSGIDIKYTTPVDGNLPELLPEEMVQARKQVNKFFQDNIGFLTKMLKYVDTDTVSHLLDKRTTLFQADLLQFSGLTDENSQLVSDLLKIKSAASNKNLSPREKMEVIKIVEIFQDGELDISVLQSCISKGIIDINSIKQLIHSKVLKKAGVEDELQDSPRAKFNTQYSYLAITSGNSENIETSWVQVFKQMKNMWQFKLQKARTNPEVLKQLVEDIKNVVNSPFFAQNHPRMQELDKRLLNMLENFDKYKDSDFIDIVNEELKLMSNANVKSAELYNVIKIAAEQDFNEYINDPSNRYGKINEETKTQFEAQKLHYDNWKNPEIPDVELEVAGKKMKIRLWGRIPQEDLFMGNKTTCCTAIGREDGNGGNGAATPVYLLNTAFQVVELFDERGNVVGMSRVYMVNIDGKPALAMDNIELNKTYIKGMTDAQKTEIRNGFFSYMNQYVEQVTGNKDSHVYFYSGDMHVPTDDLKQVGKVTKFVGKVSQDNLYINAAGCRWIDPHKMEELGNIIWLEVPKENSVSTNPERIDIKIPKSEKKSFKLTEDNATLPDKKSVSGEETPSVQTFEPSDITFKNEAEFREFLINEVKEKHEIEDLSADTESRFTQQEIDKLADLYEQDPILISKLVSKKIKDMLNTEKPRFNLKDIQIIFDLAKTEKDRAFILDAIDAVEHTWGSGNPVYTVKDIQHLLKLAETDYDIVAQLVKEKITVETESGQKQSSRHNIYDIETILNSCNTDKDLTLKYLNAKENGKPLYSASDVIFFVALEKFDAECAKKISNRFEYNKTNNFLEYLMKNNRQFDEKALNVFKKLVDIKEDNGEPLRAYSIQSILQDFEKNYDLLSDILDNTPSLTVGEYCRLGKMSDRTKWLKKLTYIDSNNREKTLLSYRDMLPFLSELDFIKELQKNPQLRNLVGKAKGNNGHITGIIDPYIENNYQLDVVDSNNRTKITYFRLNADGSITEQGQELIFYDKNGIRKSSRSFADGTKIVEETKTDKKTLTHYKKTYFDSNGNQVRSEVLTPSTEQSGEYKIDVFERENGSFVKNNVGSVTHTEKGTETRLRVNSPSGQVTIMEKTQNKDGSSSFEYNIYDTDGQTKLFSVKRSFELINENHAVSEFNGQKYDIQYGENGIRVAKVDAEGKETESVIIDFNVLDKNLMPMFKQLPGDFFFKIKQCGLIRIEINQEKAGDYNAAYSDKDKSIYMSKEYANSPGVFAHELGHAIDYFYKEGINQNYDLTNISEGELETYTTGSAYIESDGAGYLLAKNHAGRHGNRLSEVIGDIHDITSGLNTEKQDARRIILMQNEPLTIIKGSDMLEGKQSVWKSSLVSDKESDSESYVNESEGRAGINPNEAINQAQERKPYDRPRILNDDELPNRVDPNDPSQHIAMSPEQYEKIMAEQKNGNVRMPQMNLTPEDIAEMELEDIQYEAEKMLRKFPHDIWNDLKNPNWGRTVEMISESVNEHNVLLLDKIYAKFFLTKDGLKANETPLEIAKIFDKITDKTTVKLANLMLSRDISLNRFKEFIELCNDDPQFAYDLYKQGMSFENYSISDLYDFCWNSQYAPTQERELFVLKLASENLLPCTEGAKDIFARIQTENYDLVEKFLRKINETDTNKRNIQGLNVLAQILKIQDTMPKNLDLLRELDKNPPEFLDEINLFFFSPENIEKLKFWLQHPDIAKEFTGNIKRFIISSLINVKDLESGLNIISQFDKQVFEKIPEAKYFIFNQNAAFFYIDDIDMRDLNIDYDNIKTIAQYDAITARALFEIVKHGKNEKFKNLDYVAKHLKENNYNVTKFVRNAVFSDIDISQNEAAYNDIISNKSEIIKQIQLRCKDNAPELADLAETFLNSEDSASLMLIKGLNKSDFISHCFYYSRIIKAFNKNPGLYINGNYSEEILDAYKEYRKEGEKSSKYQALNQNDKSALEELNKKVSSTFNDRFGSILRAIMATDTDTIQHLLDKRLNVFNDKIDEILNIPDSYKLILSDFVKNGRQLNKNGQPVPLSPQQKTELINILKVYADMQTKGNMELNLDKYKKPLENGMFMLDINGLKKNVFNIILKKAQFTEQEIAELDTENLNWDMRYISLLSIDVERDTGELSTVVREASKGNFAKYIKDPNNEHGSANIQTGKIFGKKGLNYNAWQTGPAERKIVINNEEYTIKLWSRIPQESLFDGTYTSCCTALDAGNGGSMANYMLNTAINVVEVRNSAGEVVAMSRCFVAENNNQTPSLIIENIEVNNKLCNMLDANTTTVLSEGIFGYMKDFADIVGGKGMPVYMSTSYHKIDGAAFKKYSPEYRKISFLGKISKSEIYLNTFRDYVETDNIKSKKESFHIIREEAVTDGDKPTKGSNAGYLYSTIIPPVPGIVKKTAKNILNKVDTYLSQEKELEGGVKDTELTEVAPFAERLLNPVRVEDLRLSNKKRVFEEDIKAMVKNSPELSQNEWVTKNLDNLIYNCQPRAERWNSPIKEAAENAFIRIVRPNLKSYRLRVVETLLSHEKLYNNKNIQNNIINLIYRCWSEKDVNNLCETLELLNEHIDEIENISKGLTSFLICSNISTGKKAVIINKILENKVKVPQYWGEFINKLDKTDDLDLAFEMIDNEKFGLRFAANFLSGSKEEKIADFPYKKAFYETLKNDPDIDIDFNSSSAIFICQICKNNIDFITKNYKKLIKLGDFYSLVARTSDCSPEYMEFLQQMIDDNVEPKIIIGIAKYTQSRDLSFAKEQYKNPKVKPEELSALVYSIRYDSNDKPRNEDFVKILIEDDEFPNDLICNLAIEYNKDTANGIMKLYQDKEIPREYLSTFAQTASAPELTQERVEAFKTLISRVNIEAQKKPEVQNMIKNTITSISLGCGEFAKKMLSEAKSLPVAQTILGVTKDYNVHIANRLVFDMGLDMTDKNITDILSSIEKENASLAEIALDIKELSLDKIKDIIKKTVIEDDNDAGGNNGKPDEKKIERYKALLQNPKSRGWIIKMLNEGWDIETVSKLYKTKRGFFSEYNVQQSTNTVDSDTQFFMDFGLDEKQARAIVKAVKTGETIDKTIKDTAVKLINSDFPRGRIGEVLSVAKVMGDFNPQIVDDAISIKDLQINPLLLKNLPILKNISDGDVAVKFKPKVKKQLDVMLNALDENIKAELKAKGFDLDEIGKKLNAQKVRISEVTQNGTSGKILNNGNLRKRASISGFERVVIDRYEPSAEVWRSVEETKKWAEQKYQTFKNKDVVSIRGGEHVNTDEVNKQRRKILDKWFNFIETEKDIKDDPFIKVILADFVTNDVERDNSKLPPVFTKEKAKEILSKAQSDPNISFEKAYNAALNAAAKEASNGREVEIDGRKMTWYTVPKTDESHKNFEENAAKVRALSDGTNWCIRTWNAAPYIQKGDIHFLVDENGMTQVCVREDHGKIAEIQKRQQNATIPVAYIDFIQQFVEEKRLKGCEDGIEATAAKKPEFDRKKAELQRYAQNGDYKSIFHEMGISFLELPDGTLQISHYKPYIGDICLNDYGINENELLANVSEIMLDADFKDSNVTSLPNLREVGRNLNFGYADISNLKSLKQVNGKEINWE